MPTSNRYKLLRNGSVRTSAPPSARGTSRGGRQTANQEILTPNIEEYGHQPYSQGNLHALAQRLQDPEWSRGSLNIYGLEGLLTAMLVLPLGLRTGTWLPLIWNESGWRIPAPLRGAEPFREFVESAAGFMRMIDAGLRATPPHFESTLDTLPALYRPRTCCALQDWKKGFGLAISASNYGRVPPDSIIHRALYVIATYAKPQATSIHDPDYAFPLILREAILTLSAAHTSGGPLGLGMRIKSLPVRSRTTDQNESGDSPPVR